MAIKIAINGFGRIGRLAFRVAKKDPQFDVVAVNDLTDAKTLGHLLKYDSVHGKYDGTVEVDGNCLIVDGDRFEVLSERDPEKLPWAKLDVDYVIESTGFFRDRAGATKHLTAGAKKVIISAPASDPDATIVMGVNHETYNSAEHNIVSNASCTTNCLAPVAKVMLDNFGVDHAVMTTIHSVTNDQRILDLPHKDLRRARAANMSMIPTTTGAAKATALVIPEMKGKIDGCAVRVPTPNVSLVDLVWKTEKDVTIEDVNTAMKEAASGPLKGILQYCDEPLVSHDHNGCPDSSIFDSKATMVIGKNMVKILSWYDNEWGYSCRVIDLIKYMASK
jgi:glyceraldehyde 3-phosphate dehydrogenase